MPKKFFLSADIEGTAGIAHWNETDKAKGAGDGYPHFAAQMTREVAAACEAAIRMGAEDILVKDAHDSARNIDPSKLPELVRIHRGWAQDLLVMMSGLDETFDGVIFTGYHSPAYTNANPLAHTMTTILHKITLNGELLSELHINCLIASMLGVPVLCATGDEGLMHWLNEKNPNIETVPVSSGRSNASISIHPNLAVRRIGEAVERACAKDPRTLMFPMPDHYKIEICYKQHHIAKEMSLFPGAYPIDAHTIGFSSDDYQEVLRLMLFVI